MNLECQELHIELPGQEPFWRLSLLIGIRVVGTVDVALVTPEEGGLACLFVHRDFRRVGAGSRLVECAETVLAIHGAKRIALAIDEPEGHELIAWYLRRGFHVEPPREGRHVMSKALG